VYEPGGAALVADATTTLSLLEVADLATPPPLIVLRPSSLDRIFVSLVVSSVNDEFVSSSSRTFFLAGSTRVLRKVSDCALISADVSIPEAIPAKLITGICFSLYF